MSRPKLCAKKDKSCYTYCVVKCKRKTAGFSLAFHYTVCITRFICIQENSGWFIPEQTIGPALIEILLRTGLTEAIFAHDQFCQFIHQGVSDRLVQHDSAMLEQIHPVADFEHLGIVMG